MSYFRIGFLSLAIAFASSLAVQADIVADFNELSLGSSSSSGSFFDGYSGSASTGTWSSKGVTFNTNQFGPGWSYSNVNNPTTAGFTNQFATFTGTGFGGIGNYAMATGDGAYFDIPVDHKVNSLRISNSTYAGLSMRDGDPPPFMFAKKFGGDTGNDPDFFKVSFTGFANSGATGSVTGSVDFFLADYSFANNSLDYIVNDWRLLNLTSLGNAASVGITFDSSDTSTFMGQTFLNTPQYVAIDNLFLTSVPEPSSFALMLGVGLIAVVRNARFRRNSLVSAPTCRPIERSL